MDRICPECHGKGRIYEIVEYTKTCWQCSGRGWYRKLYFENEKQFCKRCAGKGFYRFELMESRSCPRCYGQGYVTFQADEKDIGIPV